MNTDDIFLSKSLSWLLRHGAVKEGIQIKEDGSVSLSEILNHKHFKGKHSLYDIERVVELNDKKRFSLFTDSDGVLRIKANQGHSINSVEDNLLLKPIRSPIYETVIHGTYLSNWSTINKEGLSRMNRNHIHFAKGLPTDKFRIGT